MRGAGIDRCGQHCACAREVLRQVVVVDEAMGPLREKSTLAMLAVGYIPTMLPGVLSYALRNFD